MLMDAGSGALGAATSYMRGDLGGVFKSVMGVGKRIMNGDKATEYMKQTRSSNADVISWSGCKDTCVGAAPAPIFASADFLACADKRQPTRACRDSQLGR